MISINLTRHLQLKLYCFQYLLPVGSAARPPAGFCFSGATATTILVGQEKGIDIRIALDVVRMAQENRYDVALIFTRLGFVRGGG